MNHLTQWRLALATTTLLGLSACGGGGSDVSPAAVAKPATTFSGTAATGAAMAGATVSINCASGTGTATTAANGSYTKDITDVTLPCVLKATSSDGNMVLYSVTTPSTTGSSASTGQVANITPLTQLLVASLAGTDPATFFTNFSANAGTVTASNVSTAQTAVLTTLSNAGLDVSGLTDLLTGALVPATSSTGGNVYDQILDALKARLTASGTTLDALATTVAAASPAASTTTNSNNNVASLPASLLLKAADSNCSALRTGDYWVISPTMSGGISSQFASGSFDVASKTMTNLVGSSTVLSASSTSCRYLAADGVSDVVVSQAGVLMARVLTNGTYRLSVAIPKQTIAVSELAGTWNGLGFELNDAGTAYATDSFSATVGSTGIVSTVTACDGATSSSNCTTVSPSTSFSSNSTGGFDLTSTAVSDTWTDRVFAYRAGNGDMMLVEIAGNGSVSTWTQKRTLSQPAVGSLGAGNWTVRTSNSLVANALSNDTGYTVTAVDAGTGSVTRTVLVSPGGTDTYDQTIVLNNPRAGYNFRAATTATSAAGASVAVRERTSLNLRGMGVSVQSVPSFNAFQMGIDQP
ncbi:hypothetical protein SAMN04515618_114132 [Collimonas sp. OK307]|uniref:hypothetical protein n=1 Tax=Collimonas sp. OK307 TaxID=1801620 RepID=UPI0008EC70C4|nr:hypothetical protein [Collimonas sp. OK307]SFI24138.1 hypothetical protein SAMN04515618_114132 [Collimonas sp. OK307]